jgi:hypothetical protein
MSTDDQGPIPLFGTHFQTAAQRIVGEQEERLRLGGQVLSFGVNFLDTALAGIAPRDMMLLGAKTGLGKTTLASIIAETNAEKGKRVHYFALEAEDFEIERRIKFRVLSFMAFRHIADRRQLMRLNFLDWSLGRLEALVAPWEKAANEYLLTHYRTLSTFYRVRDFTAEDLERTFLSIQDQTDLIILDHLHMVDYDDANDNRGIRGIVKKLRDCAIDVGKPVVIVAHLRKSDRRGKFLLPDIDDFHGTSDISKLVTKAILISPAYDKPTEVPYLWNTYIHPAKCRPEGVRTRYVGLVPFNVRTGRYEETFELGRMVDNGEKFEAIPAAEYPPWSKEGTP